MEEKDIVIQTTLPPKSAKQINVLAADKGLSRRELVANILQDYITANFKKIYSER